jgi:RimJ/RimL family protein N-acetyltransferase
MSIFKENLSPELSLNGEFACLEPLELGHVDDLNEAAKDGDLMNLKVTSIPSEDGMFDYIQRALSLKEKGIQLPFVVRRNSDNKIVGTTRYYEINEQNRNLSIGYTWYSASAQNTPINTECKHMLLSNAFDQAACISVQWHTYHGNTRSQKAILRLGAKFEGVLRNHMILPDGRIRHTHCFSMLDEEWPLAKANLEAKLAQYMQRQP